MMALCRISLNDQHSYTDYSGLNAATTGLNTTSVFIGSFLGNIISGVATDKLGMRIAVCLESVITLIGLLFQTAARNIAMFVVTRIVLGLVSASSSVAVSVYRSETFPDKWRAWGVGLLNDFYCVGALTAAGTKCGTWQCHSR